MVLNTMKHDQTAAWVHSICNIGYLGKQADERADEKAGKGLNL